MIFPVLSGLISPLKAPITYLLLALNFAVFMVTLEQYDQVETDLDVILTDRRFLETQGLAYATMIQNEGENFRFLLRVLSRKALGGDSDSRRILGSLALRRAEFMDRAATYSFGGDQIALKEWRGKFERLKELQARHPTYLWGLSRGRESFIQYVSYQFSHGGVYHLFWNMTFLLIFGAFIELNLGASFVVLTYVGSGLLGALAYRELNGISSVPLVGASASVTGLIALVALWWLKRGKLRFFFWLLPFNGYFGFARLPSWMVGLVLLLPDVSGFLESPPELGAVAHSAHLGGAVFGAVIAALLYFGLMRKEIEPALKEI